MTERVRKSEKELETERIGVVMQTVAKRAAFYRANPHRFVIDYLGITNLKKFQQIILCLMNECVYFMYLASRGQGEPKGLILEGEVMFNG